MISHALAFSLGYQIFYLLGVEDYIAYLDGRDGTCHLNKSVSSCYFEL